MSHVVSQSSGCLTSWPSTAYLLPRGDGSGSSMIGPVTEAPTARELGVARDLPAAACSAGREEARDISGGLQDDLTG